MREKENKYLRDGNKPKQSRSKAKQKERKFLGHALIYLLENKRGKNTFLISCKKNIPFKKSLPFIFGSCSSQRNFKYSNVSI